MACKSCGNPDVRSTSSICPKCGTKDPYLGGGIVLLFLFFIALGILGPMITFSILGIMLLIALFKN